MEKVVRRDVRRQARSVDKIFESVPPVRHRPVDDLGDARRYGDLQTAGSPVVLAPSEAVDLGGVERRGLAVEVAFGGEQSPADIGVDGLALHPETIGRLHRRDPLGPHSGLENIDLINVDRLKVVNVSRSLARLGP